MPAVGSSPSSEASDQVEKSPSASPVQLLEGLPSTPLDREAVPRLLDPYGYFCDSPHVWTKQEVPVLDIQVAGHRKTGGHTYYYVTTSLSRPGEWHSPFATWTMGRRLQHLRTALHDPVKQELGADYKSNFDGVHFARKVAVKGTTCRLDLWCKQLVQGLNTKQLPPIVAALVLRALLPEVVDPDEVRRLRLAGTEEEGKSVEHTDGEAEVGADEDDSNNPFKQDVAGSSGTSASTAKLASGVATDATPERQPGGPSSPEPTPNSTSGAAKTSPERTGSTYSSQFEENDVGDTGDTTGSEDEGEQGVELPFAANDTSPFAASGSDTTSAPPPVVGGGGLAGGQDEEGDNI